MSPIPTTILVVDDEERIRELLEETLKARSFLVVSAAHGDAALKLFEKHSPALMITDVMLPRMDGFALVEKVRSLEKGKNLPIIMMSAVYRDIKVKEKALKDLDVQYLVKPFSLVELLALIQKMLAARKGVGPSATTPTAAETPGPTSISAAPAESGDSTESTELGGQAGSLQGKIEHFSVPLVLVAYFSEQRTGILHVQSETKKIRIYLEKGAPVFAEGKIRRENPTAAAEVIRAAMGLSAGEFRLEIADTLPADLPRFQYDLYNLVLEGARRYYRLDLLVHKFQAFQNHLVKRAGDFQEKIKVLPLNPDEQEIMNQIDDIKTVGHLATLKADRLENVFQILWILNFLGAIEFTEAGNR